ncbi:MAG: 4a-hydroxytetrahydrobiopterin dehydratase [Gammaproteobacteria bacterium]|nr:4a-hydroxytetrahydrobiopterin dehydratase [Gammaproteobacteria bacterium]
MNTQQIHEHLASLKDWELDSNKLIIHRKFQFQDFHKTMGFVNAVADIAHQENHHPNMEVGYNYCHINYTTHSTGGLSDKDFICASRIDALSF